MKHDYKPALAHIDSTISIIVASGDIDEYRMGILKSARNALRIADALMGEPSEAMCEAGQRGRGYNSINPSQATWTAMRDQFLKEVGE